MKEDRIKKAIIFLKDDKIKGVPYEEKITYLKGKLTEEELSEALTRLKSDDKGDIGSSDQLSANNIQRSYSTPQPTSPRVVEEYRPQSSTSNKFMKALNIGAIAAASSIGISYMMSNMKDKKDRELFQVMKDFQEQSVNQIQQKLNEIQEENSRLRAKMLTEADVKMIVAKALENKTIGGLDSTDEAGKRKPLSMNEPISLQIKGGRNRFPNGAPSTNSKNRSSLSNSTESDQKRDSTFELCEQMNKFLKTSQESNAEMMREMKGFNQSMSTCFTTLSIALNKLSGKLETSEPVRSSMPASSGSLRSTSPSPFVPSFSNPSAMAAAKAKPAEEVKESLTVTQPPKESERLLSPTLPKTDMSSPRGSANTNDSAPKIEEESPSVDDILKVGEEVNKQPQLNGAAKNSGLSAFQDLGPAPIYEIDLVVQRFVESLDDLPDLVKTGILKSLASTFQIMAKNPNEKSFKINLENRRFSKLVEYKNDEVVQLLRSLGFKETSSKVYEPSDVGHIKSVLTETKFISKLNESA